MNHIFKTYYNRALGTWVAVPETACVHGKSSTRAGKPRFIRHALAATLFFVTAPGLAAPVINNGTNPNSLIISPNPATPAQASGTDDIAVGNGSKADSSNHSQHKRGAIAIGRDSQSLNKETIAIGYKANAALSQGIAIGAETKATGDQSTALGNNVVAQGNSSVAIGGDDLDKFAVTNGAGLYKTLTGDEIKNGVYVSTAAGDAAVAVGVQATAKGSLSTAFGTKTTAGGLASTALGVGANANKDNAVALGAGTTTETNATAVTTATVGGITYKDFAGGANIQAGDQVSVGKLNFERQIKHVAPGEISKTSTDAINGSQLYAVAEQIGANKTHYYSVKGSASTDGNYNNDGATGTHALAAGVGALASDEHSIAVGSDVQATKSGAIALGNTARATGQDSMAIGKASKAAKKDATAVGNTANATEEAATAIGTNAQATNTYTTAVGTGSAATGGSSSAFGNDANAGGWSAVAVGRASTASGASAVAVGETATASAQKTVAVGFNAQATKDGAVAVGSDSLATNASTALGDHSTATGLNATALGWQANAAGRADVFIGKQAGFGTNNSDNFDNVGIGESAAKNAGSPTKAVTNIVAIGTGAAEGIQDDHNIAVGAYANGTGSGNPQVTTSNNIAIGQRAYAKGGNSIAMGQRTKAEGSAALAFGVSANAAGTNSFAAGQNAKASGAGSVAIGGSAQAASAAQASGSQAIAIGQGGNATATQTMAMGVNAKATHAKAVALGSESETAAAVGTNDATVNGIKYNGFAGKSPIATVSVGKAGGERTLTNVAAGRINATSTDAINGSQLYLTQQALGNVGKTTAATLGGDAKIDEDGNITMTNVGNTGKGTVHDAIEAVNKTANAGWKVQVNSGTSENVKPNDTVTFKDGNNITITNSGKEITIATKPDLKADSLTINNGGPIINGSGIDMKNKKITDVAAGTAGTDAVNVSQLNQAINNVNNNVAAAKTHYYSVKSSETGTGSNYNNDGATGTDALAAGVSASAAVNESVAIGKGAKTTGTGSGATAIGRNATANGQGSTSIGINARSDGQSIAIGTNANNRFGTPGPIGSSSVAIGNNTSAAGINTVATGNEAIASREQATAIGFNTKAYGKSSVAFGDSAVSGVENDAEVAQTVAVGVSSQATGHGSSALGSRSKSTALYGTSLGISSKNSVDFGVALGALSTTDGLTVGNAGYVMPSANAADKAAVAATKSNAAGVSIGGKAESVPFMPNGVRPGQEIRRQIHYVAAGTADTDAVNVAQLKAAQTHYYSVNDNGTQVNNYNNDGAKGVNSLASGTSASVGERANNAVAVGNGATVADDAKNAVAVGNAAKAQEQNAVALGNSADAAKTDSTALGNGAQASEDGGVALGAASKADRAALPVGADATDSASAATGTVYAMPDADAADVAAISATVKGDKGAVSVGDAGNTRQIINVAAGSEDSDAVNVAQLKAVAKKANGTTIHNHSHVTRVTQVVNNTKVSAGKNIQVRKNGDDYNVALADDITLNSVTTGDARMNPDGFAIAGNSLNKDGLTVNGDTYVSADGLNANNRAIQNVAPGRIAPDSEDAVNGAQLYAFGQRMDKRIDSARAGVASAIATAGLPQAYRPGASMVAAAGGYYDGQSAVAIGLSTISDNGRWIIKGAANVNSKEAGASIGVGYQW